MSLKVTTAIFPVSADQLSQTIIVGASEKKYSIPSKEQLRKLSTQNKIKLAMHLTQLANTHAKKSASTQDSKPIILKLTGQSKPVVETAKKSQMLTIAPNSRIRQPRFIALVGTVATLTAASAALAAKVGPLAAAALIAGHASTAATAVATNTTVLAPLIAAHTITFLTPGVAIVGGAVKLAVSATAVTTATVVMPFLMPVISTVVVGAAAIILAIYLINKMIGMIQAQVQAAFTAAGKALDANPVGWIAKKALMTGFSALWPFDITDIKQNDEVASTTTLEVESQKQTPQTAQLSPRFSNPESDNEESIESRDFFTPNDAFF